jgi:hypothetical protein
MKARRRDEIVTIKNLNGKEDRSVNMLGSNISALPPITSCASNHRSMAGMKFGEHVEASVERRRWME